MFLRFACILIALFHSLAWAGKPVAFVLASTPGVVVTNLNKQSYEALPLQRYAKGHQLQLKKGARLSLAILGTGHRRVYLGPARLQVGDGIVSVRSGPAPQVSSLRSDDVELVEQWLRRYPRRSNLGERPHSPLRIVSPPDEAMLLTRSPELEFAGDLPREGSFLLFDGQGKRRWVQQLESHRLEFPKSVGFEWGERFTWEVRKLTGGRVLSGSFHIAGEETARVLLKARVPNLPRTLPETRLLYGMRLQLINAYLDAQSVWTSLGFELDQAGRPSRLD